MSVEWILSEVKGYKYVSFDVFDTLLIRPYARLQDLFKHIEVAYDVPGFTDARDDAELRGRGLDGKEVDIDEIYELMPSRFKQMRSVELEFHSRAYCPPHIRDCFNELCKRCRVILITDSYLPKTFIEGVLKRCGLVGYDDLYVSCEYRFNKGSGTLFRRLVFDYRIWPKELVHIGSDILSDYHVPRGIGIYAAHTKRPIDGYLKAHPLICRYCASDPCLERSMLVSLDMIHSFERSDDFWYDSSFRFGGPLALDYVNFIRDHHKRGDTVLFMARGGYNLKRIFSRLYPNENAEYIYAPHMLNILVGSRYQEHKGHQEMLVKHFYPDFVGDPYHFFEERKKDIENKRRELFDTYSSTLGRYGDICLVDVSTNEFMPQTLIKELCPDSSILGLYYFVSNADPSFPHHGYHECDELSKIRDNKNITEFFLTSPEPPVDGIYSNGRPRFREVSDKEKRRLEIYDSVSQGEVDFCSMMNDLFGEHVPRFGYEHIRGWLEVLVSPLCFRSRRRLAGMKRSVDYPYDGHVSAVYHPEDTPHHVRFVASELKRKVSRLLKKR